MRSSRGRLLALSIACALAATGCVRQGGTHSATPTVVVTGPPAGAVTTLELVTPPTVDAAAYAVLDVATGSYLADRDADEQRPVASITKLLTAYVVMQAGDPTHVVTVPDMPIDPEESVIGLRAGEQLPRDVLLRAMLIVSANDAARALAVDLAGSPAAFAELMNDAAATLGLTNTNAVNPDGLDADGAHSSARDVARLAAVLMSDATFRQTVARTDARLHGQVLPATNDDFLRGYPGADGVKTGTTTHAGHCLVASATRNGRTLIAVVLGASSEATRTQSATTLLDWAFAQPS
jgi:D-alanyl-D-alanine carboxypeptidase (penicillin-binding protein 5/6)